MEKTQKPKFNIGDWIVSDLDDVNEDFRLCKIIDTEDGCYVIQSDKGCKGYNFFEIWESDYHLWSIKDAKDGDVLATDSWLYIFKDTNNKAIIQFHCTCPINGKPYKWCFSSDNSYLDIYVDANIHPATKEQRDLLFQKMCEEGFEWDVDKKELKKIGMKSVWGEEDEKMLIDCFNVLHRSDYPRDKVKKTALWVKSLKDKIISQPQQNWSEEDNETLDRIILNYQYFCTELSLKDALTEVEKEVINNVNKEDIKWLKLIKNRVGGE